MSTEERNMEGIILKKAEELFLEKGFASVSTTQIAREVGCNQALVHYYFRTKEKLFNAVFDTKFKIFSESLLPLFGRIELSFLDRIREVVSSHFDILREHPTIPRFILNELTGNELRRNMLVEKFKNLSQHLYADLQKELDEEYAKGNIVEIRAVDLMLDIVHLNISVFVTYPLASEIYRHYSGTDDYLTSRKKENITLIINRLTKK
jgi:AcrR family transcriptional regulator